MSDEIQADAGAAGSLTRVLYCIDAMAPGGTEKQLAELIRGLDRSRFEPTLCTLKPSSLPLDSLECRLIELSLESFKAPSAFGQLRTLRNAIGQHRIDVIHTFFQDATLAATVASLGTRVRARIAAFRDLGFWRTPGKVWALRRAYRYFDAFTANSRAVADQIQALDGIPAQKIEVIYNGVTPRPRSTRHGAGAPTVGLIANLNRPVKRVDLFIEAAAIVAREIPEVRFTIVGDGPLRDTLATLARERSVAESIRFAGQVSNVDVELSTFDIGVLSSDSEGLSNALLEYMAAGVPAVARRVGGNSELIVDGQTGMLVDGDRAADLASAILYLLRHPDVRRRMGDEAWRLAATEFGMIAYVRRHERLYDRLVDRRAPSGTDVQPIDQSRGVLESRVSA